MTYTHMEEILEGLASKNDLRSLPEFEHQGRMACKDGRRMLNLSSNDYLGLAAEPGLSREFMEEMEGRDLAWSASSSRLLTGNFEAHRELETTLARLYGKEAALVFNSGYHANSGILPAISDKDTLILADKLVHASLIDGIQLSGATCIRYRHNNLEQLERLLDERHGQFSSTIIVTESIFSMDGDQADLRRLCQLRKKYPDTMLYVDEAHAFGVAGPTGLGCCEEQGCIEDVDLLVGTFGKAAASCGAFVVCNGVMRDWLVNTMRPFIFTTALPPVNLLWTSFIIRHFPQWKGRRDHLKAISSMLKKTLEDLGYPSLSESAIIPLTLGDSGRCVEVARTLQKEGFYALPVRPPTVPAGTSRIRFSLSAAISGEEMLSLGDTLMRIL